MKILILSDIHSAEETLKKLLKTAKNREFELILVAGDFSATEKKTKKIIHELKKTKKKILAVPGNHDVKETIKILEKEKICLHGKKEQIQEYVFAGFGGAENTTGNFVFTEKEIYTELKKILKKEKKKIFLLTHSVPKNCRLDKTNTGKHIGSKAVKKIIKEFSPEFNTAGHCHEGTGKEIIEKTLCINVSSVKEGKMIILNTKTKKIEWIE